LLGDAVSLELAEVGLVWLSVVFKKGADAGEFSRPEEPEDCDAESGAWPKLELMTDVCTVPVVDSATDDCICEPGA